MTHPLDFGILGRVCHWPSVDLEMGRTRINAEKSEQPFCSKRSWVFDVKLQFKRSDKQTNKQIQFANYHGWRHRKNNLQRHKMVFSQLEQICTVQPDVSWSKGGSTMGFGNQRAASWGHKGEFLTLACVAHLPFSTFLITHGCSILIAEEMSCQRPYVTAWRQGDIMTN